MKTKREVFQHIAKYKGCYTSCHDCPYSKKNTGKDTCIVKKLISIGAMAILRMFRKKKKPILEVGSKIRFDNGKLYTIEKRVNSYNREEYCLRDKNTMVCYSIDYLIGRTWEVV